MIDRYDADAVDAILEDIVTRTGLLVKTDKTRRSKYSGKATPVYEFTDLARRLAIGNSDLFKEVCRAATDLDPEALNKFFVANKAALDRYRD